MSSFLPSNINTSIITHPSYKTEHDQNSSITSSIAINIGIGVLCFGIYSILREKWKWIYRPKSKTGPHARRFLSDEIIHADLMETWKYTYSISEQQLLDSCGLDAVMFLRFFSTCLQFCLYATIIGCILMGVNYTATSHNHSLEYDPRKQEHTTRFDMLSIANIPTGAKRLYLHAFAAYAFAFLAFRILYHTYSHYTSLRHQFLRRSQLEGRGLTCMVDHLPSSSHTSDKALHTFFDKLYPSQVKYAVTIKDSGQLAWDVEERQRVVHELEHAYALMAEHPEKKRPTMRVSTCSCEKVDSIQHLTMKLDRLNRNIMNAHQQIVSAPGGVGDVYPSISMGFVTWSSSYLASTTPCVEHNAPPFQYRVRQAPEPRDLDWTALRQPLHKKWIRTFYMQIVFVLMIVFWGIPVMIAQSFGNLRQLQEHISWLRWIPDYSPSFRGVLEAFLPGAILIAFMTLLPIVLLAMAKYQGIPSQSWQQRSVLRKYFIIQVFNFFMNVFAGSALLVIGAVLDHPADIVLYLGHSMPKLSTFFTTYIMLRAFSGFPLQLLRLGPLIIGNIQKTFWTNTKYERDEIEKPSAIEYGAEYPEHLLVFMIAIAYSPISPIILPFAALFFGLGWFVYRHQLIYVYIAPYECGGHFWPLVYDRMMIAFLLSQLTLIGVLAYVKQAWGPMTILIPLPIITVLFQRYCNKAFYHKSERLPIEDAIAVDKDRRVTVRVGADVDVDMESSREDGNGEMDDDEKEKESLLSQSRTISTGHVNDPHATVGGLIGEVSPYIQPEFRAPVTVQPVLSRAQSPRSIVSPGSFSKHDTAPNASQSRASPSTSLSSITVATPAPAPAPASLSASTPLLNKSDA